MPHLESKTKLILIASVNWYIKKNCSIRLIRSLEQIILLWVANAPSAFFQPKQNIFTNYQ